MCQPTTSHNYKIILTHWLPELFAKNIFWTFWKFSDWIWAKLAQIYSKRHFQHDSMPFFPLASRFTTFLLGHIQRSKFWVFGWESFLTFFFAFPFYPFLILLQQWLTFDWACFSFKNFQESIIKTGNFCYGVATCNGRKFCSECFTQISEHFCAYFAPLSWSLWSGYHNNLDRSFPPAEVEYRRLQF